MKYLGPLSVDCAKIYFKQRDDHTCYIIKYSVTVLVLYDKWNQEVEQTNGAESRRTVRRWLVHIPDHIFRKMNGCLWFLKYTETGNVLETIGKFQRQFPSQGTPCRQTIMDNYNKYMSSMVKFGRERRQQWTFLFGNCLWNLLIVSRTLPVSVYSKTINTCSSTKKNCGLGCAPAIFVQFFCFLFHSSVWVLGFTL